MFWVEVLNRALESGIGGEHDALPPAEGPVAGSELAVLRALYAALNLPRELAPAERDLVEQWLAEVTLLPPVPPSHGPDGALLRARRRHPSLPADLDTVLTTALVQLLAFEDVASVQRCHGLVRATSAPSPYKLEDDRLFARRAGFEGMTADWRQCPRLVAGPRAGRFCSKTCSNIAFATRKAARDPRYFAEKQRLYRSRQRATPARPTSSPFMFVD